MTITVHQATTTARTITGKNAVIAPSVPRAVYFIDQNGNGMWRNVPTDAAMDDLCRSVPMNEFVRAG